MSLRCALLASKNKPAVCRKAVKCQRRRCGLPCASVTSGVKSDGLFKRGGGEVRRDGPADVESGSNGIGEGCMVEEARNSGRYAQRLARKDTGKRCATRLGGMP